ncbi:aminoglycoside phosphotransferase family protein [Kitasatospora indigofera]|uniref:aminoglycoside phosphotransferase family protein n=1 Tax=Kitasatospora indigofera TaxID=67307 RepID=UPI0033A3D79F
MDAAVATVRELGRRQPDLLDGGGLHAGNVLRADREPWPAVDPKGYAGDPAYDGGALLTSRAPALLDADDLRTAAHRILDLLRGRRTRPRTRPPLSPTARRPGRVLRPPARIPDRPQRPATGPAHRARGPLGGGPHRPMMRPESPRRWRRPPARVGTAGTFCAASAKAAGTIPDERATQRACGFPGIHPGRTASTVRPPGTRP